jgi:hypothetical protein
LIWQALIDGLDFAAINTPKFPTSAALATNISARLVGVDKPWEPACKVLIGALFTDPAWNFNVRWTFFESSSKTTASEPLNAAGQGLFPLWLPPQAALSTIPVYASASGKYQLHYNGVDFELAYMGKRSENLSLKVHGGLKGILLKQLFHADYANGFFDGTNQMLSSSDKCKSNCRGLGPRVGLGSKWSLPMQFSLLAEIAGAFTLCELDSKRIDSCLGTSSGVPNTLSVNFREAFWVYRPVAEAKVGALWEKTFGGLKRRFFGFEFAYEVQYFWEQNMMPRLTDGAIFSLPYQSRGSLTLQGFSFNFHVGY